MIYVNIAGNAPWVEGRFFYGRRGTAKEFGRWTAPFMEI